MASLLSSTLLASILVFMSGLASLSLVSAGSCASCPITHPQQKFCMANYVLKVRTVSWQYVNRDQQPVLYAHEAYDVQYKLKVENVFKGEDEMAKMGNSIYVYSPKNVCNIDRLEMGIRYLISGTLKDNKMEVTTCGIVEKWSDLTPSQRRGVRGAYQAQCSSCTVYGSTVIRYYGGNEIIDEMSSGLWSKQECFFNPLASLTYGSDDCETKHSYCMRQKDGACAWEGGKAYDECFRQREYNWQLMQFAEMGLAAWTCPEQCKNLTPRRLKYKCKKATRKMAPCNSGDTVREFRPSSGSRQEAVRTIAPSNRDVVRTVQPNVVRENPPTESPEIMAALSALFDAEI